MRSGRDTEEEMAFSGAGSDLKDSTNGTTSSEDSGCVSTGARESREEFRCSFGRIFLSPPKEQDWKEWAVLREKSRAFLVPWEPTWDPDVLSRSFYEDWVRYLRMEWEAGLGYGFFVRRERDRALLGGINLTNVRRDVLLVGTIGYWMGECFSGRGYMREGLTAMLHVAFQDLGLNRAEAACIPRNARSRAVLSHAGFSEIGLAERYMCINAHWEDHVLFEALSPNFP